MSATAVPEPSATATKARRLLVLKIDVDTLRGTLEGVPNLVRQLSAHQAGATFLFSLGPDHTGRAMRRALRPGFFGKVTRTSVLEHYGVKTLLYGVLLPGPDIGKVGAAPMRAARDAGFECGVHSWDHVQWHDQVARRDPEWTRARMRSAAGRYREVFGAAPLTCGAAGWQMNGAAFAEHDSAGYGYASDGRCRLNEDGTLCDPADGPHRLADAAGAPLAHIQLPTTLPTLDELLGRDIDGQLVSTANVADFLLRLTAGATRDHVYTLHAELEGQKLAPIFEQLLTGWRAQGYQLASMADYFQQVRAQPLPVCPITWGQVPGRSGQLIVQGGARPTPVHPQEKASG